MTKVIILGEPTPEQPKKPIELKLSLTVNRTIIESNINPKLYKNIELISSKYDYVHDLMYAYDTDRNDGCLYLGHFNDGVV